MHGHNAHRSAARFHIALNVLAALTQPMDKALQAGRMRRLIGQCQAQQFAQRVVNFRSQARAQ